MSDSNKDNDVLKALAELSIKDFLTVGLDQVAYIKHIKNLDKASDAFAVHAADGSQLSVMESYDMALASLRLNDLHAVTVH